MIESIPPPLDITSITADHLRQLLRRYHMHAGPYSDIMEALVDDPSPRRLNALKRCVELWQMMSAADAAHDRRVAERPPPTRVPGPGTDRK